MALKNDNNEMSSNSLFGEDLCGNGFFGVSVGEMDVDIPKTTGEEMGVGALVSEMILGAVLVGLIVTMAVLENSPAAQPLPALSLK